MPYSIHSLGDSAITVDFGSTISTEINKKVMGFVNAIDKAALPAIKDVVPAYCSVTIHYDVIVLLKQFPNLSPFSLMREKIEALLLKPLDSITTECRSLHIPVCYSLKYGLDLISVSEQKKLKVEQIVNLHQSVEYKVYMIGFLPGFAYMGNVDERIRVPRKAEPRLTIEAGCVGIAGEQTGIYSMASPGGWQIIGRTPLKLFDSEKEDPAFFRTGDEVTFYSITEDEFDNY